MLTVSDPAVTKTKPSTSDCGSGAADPPPGATSTMVWAKVCAPPGTGRLSTQARVSVHSGKTEVTMSRSTPRGITVYASVTTARSLSRSVCGGSPPAGV